MPDKQTIARYRRLYALLLRLYPKPYRARFSESMEQTFQDLCRERLAAGDGVFWFALWTFTDTFAGIVNENRRSTMLRFKSTLRIAIGTGILLLIPLVLTIRDGGVEGVGWNWSPGDFIIMGVLLFGTGLALDFALRRLRPPAYRLLAVTGIVMAFFLIWAELAVHAVSHGLALVF